MAIPIQQNKVKWSIEMALLIMIREPSVFTSCHKNISTMTQATANSTVAMAYHARGQARVRDAMTKLIIIPPSKMMIGVIANQSMAGYCIT